MLYARLPYDAADASWVGASAYTRPAYDEADVAFGIDFAGAGEYESPLGNGVDFPEAASGTFNLFLADTPLTGVYLGSTACQVYFGSTLVFG